MPPELPSEWILAASAFNWTPDVIRAERTAADIAIDIPRNGVAESIEIELGQTFRGYPTLADPEIDAVRARLDAAGGRVSIVGASLDDVTPQGRPLDDDERLAFLLPQLRAAQRLGALGIRLPMGQAGAPLLRRLLPTLHELGLTLFEEIQGQQTPDNPVTAAAIDVQSDLDDPLVRVLVDISMLMPELPVSYLEVLRRAGIPDSLLDQLTTDWRSPATNGAVVDLLRSGGVPPQIHTLFMNLLVRFGRSDASVLRGILPMVGGFHLKFWDLDDTDGRVSNPIRDLGRELAGTSFAGTLCSEWGGHEWLDDDATVTTRAHLALARESLAR